MDDQQENDITHELNPDPTVERGRVQPDRFQFGISIVSVCASTAVMVAGFVRAYTYDDTLAGTGAAPVSAMSGVVGLALFIEVFATMRFTTVSNLTLTMGYRLFFYATMSLFGFLSMSFYAAPITVSESLACFGCFIWIFQSAAGASYLLKVKWETELLIVTNPRHCCGVGCCTKSGWGMCCRWTLWVFGLLFFVQACAVLNDDIRFLRNGVGLVKPINLVSVRSPSTGKLSKLAIYCTGQRGTHNLTVILEAGGGSGLGGMLALQRNLTEYFDLRVCSYDRPGYGFSQTSLPYASLEVQYLLVQALEQLGETGPYICAGHSAGGTNCRNLHRLFPADIIGIVLLDAYCNTGDCNIEVVWDIANGLGKNAYDSVYGLRLTAVDALRYFAPFTLVRAFIGGPGIEGANYGGTLAWNTQFTEFRPSPNGAAIDSIVEEMWYTPGILGNIPLLVATANFNETCMQAGKVDNEYGNGCTKLLQKVNATKYEISKYMATSNFSASADCGETCDHGFVQTKPSIAAGYVMQVVRASQLGFWS